MFRATCAEMNCPFEGTPHWNRRDAEDEAATHYQFHRDEWVEQNRAWEQDQEPFGPVSLRLVKFDTPANRPFKGKDHLMALSGSVTACGVPVVLAHASIRPIDTDLEPFLGYDKCQKCRKALESGALGMKIFS